MEPKFDLNEQPEVLLRVLGNIGPRSFLHGPWCTQSVLPRPRANIPQYGPRIQLVRGCYFVGLVRYNLIARELKGTLSHRNIKVLLGLFPHYIAKCHQIYNLVE